MKKLVHTDVEFPEDILGITWGRYNDLPTPNRELDLNEALLALYTDDMGAAEMYDTKQCPLPGGFKGHWNVTLHVWRDKVIAVCKWYERYDAENRGSVTIGRGVWVPSLPYRDGTQSSYGYFMRFFRIGCDHPNMRELSQEETRKRGRDHRGMFDHYFECPDCGYTRRTDSSG